MSLYRTTYTVEGRRTITRRVRVTAGAPASEDTRLALRRTLAVEHRADLVDVELRHVESLDGGGAAWTAGGKQLPDVPVPPQLTVAAVKQMRKADLVVAAAELGIEGDFSQIKVEDLRDMVLAQIAPAPVPAETGSEQ